MLSHDQIWGAIDTLAQRYGFTASGLARKAGLDATTFNRSKRVAPDGRERWPSTESIAKILAATGASLDEFMSVVLRREPAPARTIPLIGFAQAGSGGFFDDGGFPVGTGWEEVAFPGVTGEKAYALEIAGDAMAPIYRDGDVVVVSPAAGLRRGDRVVAKTAGGLLIGELVRISANRIDLKPLSGDQEPQSLKLSDVAWKARIVWSSQ